ncbi:stonustoxin subunit beta-like [Siniperca chuatsi]|uniref:stonustoxin subunit beta-like n=1 Tax=Siniperca chuatsi TaxID=119488 RepID=UPI001CE1BABB|nr:stonustoxin subunit beta-like [Siniperca chuatsi]
MRARPNLGELLLSSVSFSPSDACELTLDPNTANRKLILSDYNTKVTVGREKQPYPDDPERFDYWKQLLCTDGLTGRCYWEVEWTGKVYIAVTYRGIRRRGESDDCCLGSNDQSWSLSCSGAGYSGLHSKRSVSISIPPSNRVGVYLDWPAGTLSFYRISSDKLTLLHTFYATFTEPVYPAFRIKMDPYNSSVSLC